VIDKRFAHAYTVTLPTEQAARAMAERLAERGHQLVAARIVDHFSFDPTSSWYGKPSRRAAFAGWWDAFSVCVDPSSQSAWIEAAAVRGLARGHGGVVSGGSSGGAASMLSTFTRVGLLHELSDDEAERRRRAALADLAAPAQPAPPSAPPLACRSPADERAEALTIVACLADLVDSGRAETLGVAEGLADLLDGDADEDWEDAGELLGDLFNEAMHQGTCYPHTASMVPVFATLATSDRISDQYRAWVLLDLYLIATVGRRDLCARADKRHALAQPAVAAPEAIAAREAVATVVPRLVDRWGEESEFGRFVLAALVAACPDAGARLRPDISRLGHTYAGTDRAATMRLIEALAGADPTLTATALRDIASWNPKLVSPYDSPYATAEQRGLCVLQDLIIEELSRV